MIIEKLFSSLRSKKKPVTSVTRVTVNIIQVNYFPTGKETFLRERAKIIDEMLMRNRLKDTGKMTEFLVECSSYDETWALACNSLGEFSFLSDKGRKITGDLGWLAAENNINRIEVTCEAVLPETSRSDSFPAPGFGHASFFFVYGRAIYFAKKHIPLLERLESPFKVFFEMVKVMKDSVMNNL